MRWYSNRPGIYRLIWGMVKLTPDQQQKFVRSNPEVFAPENGAWGRAGCTKVQLDSVDENTLGEVMTRRDE